MPKSIARTDDRFCAYAMRSRSSSVLEQTILPLADVATTPPELRARARPRSALPAAGRAAAGAADRGERRAGLAALPQDRNVSGMPASACSGACRPGLCSGGAQRASRPRMQGQHSSGLGGGRGGRARLPMASSSPEPLGAGGRNSLVSTVTVGASLPNTCARRRRAA